MVYETLYTRFLAVSQTLGTQTRGFNYEVTVAVQGSLKDISLLSRVLKQIDHMSLGQDVKLNEEPTTPYLAQWIQTQLKKQGVNVTEVRLKRGDGQVSVAT